MSNPILVCDDEEAIRFGITHVFEEAGYTVIQAEDGFHCLEHIAKREFSLIILDLKMPGMDGLTVLRKLNEKDCKTPVIVITGHGDIDSAIRATRYGAVSFVQKPFDFKEILFRGEQAIGEYVRNQGAARLLDEKVKKNGSIVCQSQAMLEVINKLKSIENNHNQHLFFVGEASTGKQMLARVAHHALKQSLDMMITVDCHNKSALEQESELFGSEPGYNSLLGVRTGAFQTADQGTVLIYGATHLHPENQKKLARVLESKKYCKLGSGSSHQLKATMILVDSLEPNDGKLEDKIHSRLLDLMHVVSVPALRQRSEDLALLIENQTDKISQRRKKDTPAWSEEALTLMKQYDWPGNARELHYMIEQVLAKLPLKSKEIGPEHLPVNVVKHDSYSKEKSRVFILPEQGINLADVQADFIAQALELSRGNKSKAAKLLGISRDSLRYQISK
ncbi:MAG: sigma-54-dependent Fis family transcriptional regulator [Deltaproteobacteria bacterium]|nr:sigma-54-dependent Fis family transcriptional regulator [Deltaproteobacteria bacterium]